MTHRPTTEIITDAEIDRVHANANFGSMSKRGVVDEGMFHTMLGYITGHTMDQILREHGLTKGRRFETRTFTDKGYEYLRAMFNGASPQDLAKAREEHL